MSHNSSFTDPDARHVVMLSSPAATEYELVSSLFHLHGHWSLHVSVNSLSWKDHHYYYYRCHKNVWINIFSVQQAAVFNVQENLTLTRWTNTCWPKFMANWNISDHCTACYNAMLSDRSVMWCVRKKCSCVCRNWCLVFDCEEFPIVLTTEIMETQKLVYYPVFHSRTKHVDTHQHIIQET